MRCLLVNPFCPITEGPTPPLGISFLGAVLEQAGHETRIVDFSVFPYSHEILSRHLQEFKPDLLGVTSVTMTFNAAIQVVEDARKINPELPTLMGGPHVSFCAHETLSAYPSLDLIVVGEGEQTIVEVANQILNDRDWSQIKGLAYRDGNQIKINEKREYLDVNTLPFPARHLLPLGRYRALHTPISIATSRGCPYRCIFCVGRKMVGAKVRYRDPIAVCDELEMLSKLNFPQINISDDLFTAKTSHCLAICDEIIRRKLNITWSSFARVDTVSPELLIKMKEAGCSTISFGVESANREILKTIKKGITLEKVERAVKMCSDAGIQPHVSFILGLPGESPESLKETQDYGDTIERLGGMYGFHLLAPFPGTAVRDDNDQYDLSILTDNWDEYHANHAIVETDSVDKNTLNAIAEEWDYETKKQLEEIRVKMKNGTATEDEAWKIDNLERFLFIYQLMMESIIENYGTWELETAEFSEDEAILGLAERIHEKMNQPLSRTQEILTYAVGRDSIFYSINNNQMKWEWRTYL